MAKRTGRKFQLTWCPYKWTSKELREDPTRLPGRWCRRHNGKQLWIHLRKGETKEGSYQRCFAEFLDKTQQVDDDAFFSSLSYEIWHTQEVECEKLLEHAKKTENRALWYQADQWLRKVRVAIQQRRGHYLADKTATPAEDSLAGPPPWENQQTEVEKTLKSISDRFLRLKRSQIRNAENPKGKISASRYEWLARCVGTFVDFLGPHNAASVLRAEKWGDYHAYLKDQATPRKWSVSTCHELWSIARQFVSWMVEEEHLDRLPNNFKSKELVFTKEAKEIQAYPVDELRQVLELSQGRLRLYLLLMANCGMTQVDISDLAPDEVDWKEGRLTRKRSKTSNYEDVPKVEYKLWPETFTLLKEHRSNNPEHVLIARTGATLVTRELRSTGMVHVDNIRLNYVYLTDKANLKNPRPLKQIRKTSSSLLANKFDEALAEHFLGHVPMGVGRRHYLVVDQGRFDEAIHWLGEQLGVYDLKPVPSTEGLNRI